MIWDWIRDIIGLDIVRAFAIGCLIGALLALAFVHYVAGGAS